MASDIEANPATGDVDPAETSEWLGAWPAAAAAIKCARTSPGS